MNARTDARSMQRDKYTGEVCGTCRYYRELFNYQDIEPDEPDEADEEDEVDDDPTGICRRYPPRVFPGLTPISVYPDVSGNHGWCGEYTPASLAEQILERPIGKL